MFFSLFPDSKTQDQHSMHTGCPVLRGIKWTGTVWVHTAPFRPESLSQESEQRAHPRPSILHIPLDHSCATQCHCWSCHVQIGLVMSWSGSPSILQVSKRACLQRGSAVHPCGVSSLWAGMQQEDAATYLPEDCQDQDTSCARWAKAGECQKNPTYMVGDQNVLGACRLACDACEVCKPSDAACRNRNRVQAGFPSLADLT